MDNEIVSEFFNEVYRMKDDKLTDYALNSIGWNSSFTGIPYTYEEMIEWRDNTISSILKTNPKNVLEVACGTGMIMFGILPYCQNYVGFDIAEEGIDYIKKHINNQSNLNVYVAGAEDIEGMDIGPFDLAFINSATQYMGPKDKFIRILKMMVDKISYGGSIFLGDMKSECLQDMFYEAILRKSNNNMTPIELNVNIAKRKEIDVEFYIGYDWLSSIKAEIPRLKTITIEMKKGSFLTEMNLYRFNAHIYLDIEKKVSCEEIQFSTESSVNDIEKKLEKSNSNILFKYIINARLDNVMKERFKSCFRIDSIILLPTQLEELAEKFNYEISLFPNREEPVFHYDVLFEKKQ